MSNSNLVIINLAFVLGGMSQVGVAQSTSELDLTMRVIEEGQLPAGLIQQIELPPLEFFVRQDSGVTEDLSLQVQQDAVSLTEEVNDIAADQVRETISIDGTNSNVPANPDLPNTVITLPGAIVDILNPGLPLGGTLQNALDGVTDNLGGIGNAVTNPVTDIVDTTLDTVNNAVGNTVDNTLDSTVGTLNSTVTDAISGVTQPSDLQSVISTLNEVETQANAATDTLDAITDDTIVETLNVVPILDQIQDEIQATDTLVDDVSELIPNDIIHC